MGVVSQNLMIEVLFYTRCVVSKQIYFYEKKKKEGLKFQEHLWKLSPANRSR